MVILREFSDLATITHPGIQKLVAVRLQQLLNIKETVTEFIVVESKDSASEIEILVGFTIMRSIFDDLPFDHPDFFPSHEILEEHHYEQSKFYEMVFIFNDEGIVTTILIPDQDGIDTDLLALCRSWAAPISGQKVSGP
ncbi:hypothetical protein [Azonexus sp.]|uniref:hypothetical protein n=1 Tax=Azonexus sp. TaxID=1872668 RepID=UPI0035B26C6E